MKIKVELIRDFMKEYRITEYKFTQLLDVTRREMRNIFANDKKTTYYSLEQIAELMGVKITDLVE